ncbi:MAG: SH3 domain-containing protein [Lachnospiraceae bacterium]|nr:SH3 domain-containing protein [Lachnospiraceae bacterium]
MKGTVKEKLLRIVDFVLAHGKLVFPIVLIAAVAVTVTIALKAGSDRVAAAETQDNDQASLSGGDIPAELIVPDTALELNAYPEVNALIAIYFQAMADGDADTIASIQSSIDDMERIRIVELGKYIESYPLIEVYTKPGPEENSYIVIAYNKTVMSYYPEDEIPGYASFYVCSKEDGTLYINQEDVSEEVSEYIRKVVLQDDVVELCNRIEVEYKELCIEKPELFSYIIQVEQELKTAAGVILAQQISEAEGTGSVSGSDIGENEGETEEPVNEPTGPIYATTTATVNVRSSDSETADKVNKVPANTRIEVLEQRPNGWSRVSYEGSEGFIKSEYLNVVESANGVETVGTVTATTNINVRISPSQTAEKLGVTVGGETLDLIAIEGDWCKIVYNGQIGYVKAEYVKQN